MNISYLRWLNRLNFSIRIILSVITLVVLMLQSIRVAAFPLCQSPASICQQATSGHFTLIKEGIPVRIIVDNNEDVAIKRVAKSFAEDLKRVSGTQSEVITSDKLEAGSHVLIGTIGNSKSIDELIQQEKLDVSDILGQWEAFKVAVVDKPWPGVKNVLVIVGADRRGAIYGTYRLSEQMGVSPWYWFADVPVTQSDNIFVTAGAFSDQPKVRYRGFFINDEEPALGSWARKHFGGLNADMYEHVFELLLRLRGNYIWPAMWQEKSFNEDDPRNKMLADSMGVVMGTSHHEPMARSHGEWYKVKADPTKKPHWNFNTNAEGLRQFWRTGIQRMMSKGNGEAYENVVTIGMRGDGDEPMSEGTAIALLESIVTEQRNIIADVTNKPASKTPQVWALYKEVQDYYDQGMTVPEDVTLLFADDNWGQIRRLPTKDINRLGGYGVYYHFDYVGVPRNYKWTNTIQIQKVWQQMDLAYQRGARNLWVVNVGDIKPLEYPLDFFLSMAWDPEAITPDTLAHYPESWASDTFGQMVGKEIGELLTTYSQFAARRKPELINENTFPIGKITGKTLQKGSMGLMVDQWHSLREKVQKVKSKLTKEQLDAYFQFIEYPVLSLSNLYELYHAVAWNRLLASHHDARANVFLRKAELAFALDQKLTDQYHSMKQGKWDGMMSQVHMNYVIWNDPTQQTLPPVTEVFEGRNNIPVVFSNAAKPAHERYEIPASAFVNRHTTNNINWTFIDDLGKTGGAIITYPQGGKASTFNDNIYVDYEFTLPNSSDIAVQVSLKPTLNTTNDNALKLGLTLDDRAAQTLMFNLIPTAGAINSAQQQAWSNAVIDNQHVIETTFKQVTEGTHRIRIWRLDGNVVIDKLSVISSPQQ